MIYHPEKSIILTKNIGKDSVIHALVWIGKDVKIGNGVKVQAFSFIPDGVTIEDDVFIGPRVTFTNDRNLKVKGKEFWSKVLVKKGAKIGAGSCILAGVIIGENAIIGMGSVVLRDIPNGETWAGNPAIRIK